RERRPRFPEQVVAPVSRMFEGAPSKLMELVNTRFVLMLGDINRRELSPALELPKEETVNEQVEGVHCCRTSTRRDVSRQRTTAGCTATTAVAEHDVLCHRHRDRQGCRSRRPGGCRSALSAIGAAPWSGRKNLARLSEHPGC